jgi:hypothetical protein
MPRPKLHLNFDDDVLRELIFVAKHADRIEEIVTLAGRASEKAETHDFEDVVEEVAEQAKLPPGDVEQVLHTVYNITRITTRMKIDAAKFLEVATRAFEGRKGEEFSDGDLRAWKDSLKTIGQAVSKIDADHPFLVSRKADRLARAQQNIVYETKIITDLRPVFSAAGDRILRSVVNHRLVIDYFDGNRVSRMEFGLDLEDVAELRKTCERAELKALTLKDSLKDIPWVSSAPHEEKAK